MKKILDQITEIVGKAFEECGYDAKYGKTGISNRPDLCEFQCNGAMAASKEYKKAPFMIGDEVVAVLQDNPAFDKIECVKDGVLRRIEDINDEFTYTITETIVVESDEIEVLDQDMTKKEITLVTCTNGGKQRFIVKGEVL